VHYILNREKMFHHKCHLPLTSAFVPFLSVVSNSFHYLPCWDLFLLLSRYLSPSWSRRPFGRYITHKNVTFPLTLVGGNSFGRVLETTQSVVRAHQGFFTHDHGRCLVLRGRLEHFTPRVHDDFATLRVGAFRSLF
jgi:hypothetical protein